MRNVLHNWFFSLLFGTTVCSRAWGGLALFFVDCHVTNSFVLLFFTWFTAHTVHFAPKARLKEAHFFAQAGQLWSQDFNENSPLQLAHKSLFVALLCLKPWKFENLSWNRMRYGLNQTRVWTILIVQQMLHCEEVISCKQRQPGPSIKFWSHSQVTIPLDHLEASHLIADHDQKHS